MKNKVYQKVMMGVVFFDQQMGASHAGPWLNFLAFSHRFSPFLIFSVFFNQKVEKREKTCKKRKTNVLRGSTRFKMLKKILNLNN